MQSSQAKEIYFQLVFYKIIYKFTIVMLLIRCIISTAMFVYSIIQDTTDIEATETPLTLRYKTEITMLVVFMSIVTL